MPARVVLVSEAGASIYSASTLARAELPELMLLDVSLPRNDAEAWNAITILMWRWKTPIHQKEHEAEDV